MSGNKDLEILADKLAASLSQAIKSETAILREAVDRKLDQVQGRLEDRIERLREEVRADISEVKAIQANQGAVQANQGADIAAIKARLETGDQQFEKVDGRLDKLEGATATQGLTLAGIAGSVGKVALPAAVGGGAAGAILKLLGG